MQLTVLTDNNTFIDKYYLGEPALSFFIEVDGKKILFDTGYSDVFIKNAFKMGLNLRELDFIVFSHGHNDHSWGLIPLIKLYQEAIQEKIPCKKPCIVSHPLVFDQKSDEEIGDYGSLVTQKNIDKLFNMNLSAKPYWITPNLVFLGEIPRVNNFESYKAVDYDSKDKLLDDSALVYNLEQGIVIITGCSHSGICNIIEYSKKIFNKNTIIDIVGGFHLLNPNKLYFNKIIEYLKKQEILQLHPCHCTDLNSKIELAKFFNLKEVGVSLSLVYGTLTKSF